MDPPPSSSQNNNRNSTDNNEQVNYGATSNFPSVDDFYQPIISSLIEATESIKKNSQNPEMFKDDLTFLKTTSPVFNQNITTAQKKILNSVQALLSQGTTKANPPDLREVSGEEIPEKIPQIVDYVDHILEQAHHIMDNLERETDELEGDQVAYSASSRWQGTTKVGPEMRIEKPQLKFQEKIDNSAAFFVPKLTEKPNSLNEPNEPFQLVLTPEGYQHPYRNEILSFSVLTTSLQPSASPPPPQPIEQAPYNHIENLQDLIALCSELEKETEFAVDLEAHTFRSYQGLTCLIQITVAGHDYTIDPFPLREELWRLNRSFTNPNIVKILHGADSDVLWLQRDFGVYLVNLFDTGIAAKILEYPKFSFAFLLKRFLNIDADKSYQTADWRFRPLPADWIYYARQDTHFLSFIASQMKDELLRKANGNPNLVEAVFNQGREVCLRKYEKPLLTETSPIELYNRENLVFQPKQMKVFCALFHWRDQLARKEDESPRYVFSNFLLSKFSDRIPTSEEELFSLCNRNVPPLVRRDSKKILAVIEQAQQTAQIDLPSPPKDHIKPSVPIFYGAAIESPVLSQSELFQTTGWNFETPLVKKQGLVTGSQQSVLDLNVSSSDEEDEEFTQSKKKTQSIYNNLEQELLTISTPDFMEMAQEETPKPPSIVKADPPEPKKERKKAEIPQSMAEVYELSNQVKRKRNKEKKKLKEETTGKTETAEEIPSQKKKQNKDTPLEFMAEIGWIKPDQVHSVLQQSSGPPASLAQPQQNVFSNTGGNTNNSANFKSPRGPKTNNSSNTNNPTIIPFDYSNAKTTKPQTHQVDPFRPYPSKSSKTSPVSSKRFARKQ